MDFIKKTSTAFKDSVLHFQESLQESCRDFYEVLNNRPSEICKILLILLAILLVHLLILFVMMYPLYVATPELAKAFASRLHTNRPLMHF